MFCVDANPNLILVTKHIFVGTLTQREMFQNHIDPIWKKK